MLWNKELCQQWTSTSLPPPPPPQSSPSHSHWWLLALTANFALAEISLARIPILAQANAVPGKVAEASVKSFVSADPSLQRLNHASYIPGNVREGMRRYSGKMCYCRPFFAGTKGSPFKQE